MIIRYNKEIKEKFCRFFSDTYNYYKILLWQQDVQEKIKFNFTLDV